jgi:hypothetical protein
MSEYFYPYEVAKIPGESRAIVKRLVAQEDRKDLTGYVCCKCNKAWPGCACPETEEEHAAMMEAFLSTHPSVMRMRERQRAYREEVPDGWLHGQEFRQWELARYGNCI